MYYIGDCIVEGYIIIGQTEFNVFENSYTIGYSHVLIIMDNIRRLYYLGRTIDNHKIIKEILKRR